MRKDYKFDELSETKCKCGKQIKKRLDHFNMCYNCFCEKEALRGHTVNTKARNKRELAGLTVKRFND